ncbi:peptide-methionine (R)-S-oxide reductase MsrB [Fibrella sp. WM1]|uniref:peptide-methionine (R)-S-oxide reductase MsrB n=1 Tax=Fibrella musci TaxID=3242485 RepID=UPI003522DCFF
MSTNRLFLICALLLIGALGFYGYYGATPRPPHRRPPGVTSPQGRRVVKTDPEWRDQLSRAQYAVMWGGETEWPNSSDLTNEHRAGMYHCAGCHNPLFASATKYDSHTGWPSFYGAIVANAVYTEPDGNRTEVRCAVCDAHLGHVFNDGPDPTGLRYCINGDALTFDPKNKV